LVFDFKVYDLDQDDESDVGEIREEIHDFGDVLVKKVDIPEHPHGMCLIFLIA
jgi:hypothetical protein